MGIFGKNKVCDAQDGMTSANVGRARDRAARLSTTDLLGWADGVAINLSHQVGVACRQDDPTAVHEALIMSESLHGMLLELAERSMH